MPARIASLKEIGEALEKALSAAGKSPSEAVTAADPGVSVKSWYRYVNGEQEGGVRGVTQIALGLGLDPNTLLLRDQERLSDEDEIELLRVRALLIELRKMYVGPTSPIRVVAQGLAESIRMSYEKAGVEPPAIVHSSATLPIGTQIRQPEPGVKTFEPPPADEGKAKRKRKAE